MEQTVAADDNKGDPALFGKETDRRREQKREEQARLHRHIKAQGVRFKPCAGSKMEENPRQIRDDTAEKNPRQPLQPPPGHRCLQGDMT